jgi:hypothetical protein
MFNILTRLQEIMIVIDRQEGLIFHPDEFKVTSRDADLLLFRGQTRSSPER